VEVRSIELEFETALRKARICFGIFLKRIGKYV